ncbi:hypothetical protein PI125_g1710 [Phytophthora idaei]|nr:hypothetical protein PI125_g1710 [Phytophthora idaei]KAG3138462.1 hypothetical protein PI126_g16899 [Phytophthora idaei]
MTQRSSGPRALSIIQELRQLREKVCIYSEKNRELAKALTTTKQELRKARAAKSAVFSDKVMEWMNAQCKLAEGKTALLDKATQCNFEDLDQGARASLENMQLEPEPPLSPLRNGRSIWTPHSEPRALFSTPACTRASIASEQPMTIEENENTGENDDAMANRPNEVPTASFFRSNAVLTSHSSKRAGSQAGVKRRLRQRDTNMSYVEPKLNMKLRRGDYYGLGKRRGEPIPRPPTVSTTPRMISGTRCTKSSFVPARFGQQCSPFRSRRSTRPIKRISYEEPKLNTKLRQGDKFTFTT